MVYDVKVTIMYAVAVIKVENINWKHYMWTDVGIDLSGNKCEWRERGENVSGVISYLWTEESVSFFVQFW